MRAVSAVLLAAAVSVGCAEKPTAGAGAVEQMTACTEPRPQMCTMDYRPVCAVLESGERREYSNGCSACSDPAVTGYVEGACPR